MDKQVACMLNFKPGVTEEQVQKLVASLREKGVLENVQVAPYDPDYCQPTLYFP